MFDQYIESGKEALRYLKEYRKIAEKVKRIVKKRYRDARVYVFGSVVEGKFTASSDIDILIVCNEMNRDEATALKANIIKKIGYMVPIELHIATEKEFKEWYQRFINVFEEI